MAKNTIWIERDLEHSAPLYWLREESQEHPFAYVRRLPNGWWATIPGGDVHGYFPTRTQAIAALV